MEGQALVMGTEVMLLVWDVCMKKEKKRLDSLAVLQHVAFVVLPVATLKELIGKNLRLKKSKNYI